MDDKKSYTATKIATHSIGKRNAYLLTALYHLNKNQRTTFLRNADEKLMRCIGSFKKYPRFLSLDGVDDHISGNTNPIVSNERASER